MCLHFRVEIKDMASLRSSAVGLLPGNDRLKDELEETSPDETRVKRDDEDDKEGARLSAAGTPGSYGSTPVQDKPQARFFVPCCALTLYTMVFLGCVVGTSLRTSLSEAIVAMVNQTAVDDDVPSANLSTRQQCPRDAEDESKRPDGGLNWSREQQAIVLSALYYGLLFSEVRTPCFKKRRRFYL